MINAITNATIFTVNAQNQILQNGTIIWDGNTIRAIGPSDCTPIPSEANYLDAKGRLAVLPGLIDCHSHSSLLKGFSENRALLDWLPVYQREHQVLTPEDAYWASMISYLEALKGGTTCVVDMYRYLERCADSANTLGMRAVLVPYMADEPDKLFFETMDGNEKLIKTHHNTSHGRIQVMVGLEHLFYCTEDAYKKAYALSQEHGVFIHTHSSENKDEVDSVVKHFGNRPISILKKRGILTPRTIIAHAVWLDNDELDLLAENGVGVAHCPTSNAKLAGGSARIADMQTRGIKIGLGTDGTISNNSLSMWESMKFGSLLQKNTRLDPTCLSASEMMRMATIDGARLIGQDHLIGSLEVGKRADLMTVDLWQPHLFPIVSDSTHNPIIWNLVFAGRASDVHDVWIDGRQVIKQGKSTLLNEDDILNHVHQQTISLLERREVTKQIKVNSA